MISKVREKKEAIRLRKQGKTYSEILSKIPVAKSTLSLWLREVGLAKKQAHRLTQKKLDGSKRGGEAKYLQRIARYNSIISAAKNDIHTISDRELFLIGAVLSRWLQPIATHVC